MVFTVEGHFKYITETKAGAKTDGKMWKLTNFVIEQPSADGKYTNEIAFQMWEDNVNIAPGTWISVSFYPKSKMYNGKYFTNLIATQIQIGGMNQTAAPAQTQQYKQQQQPQYQQPQPMPTNQMPPQAPRFNPAPAPQIPTNNTQEDDDMPF